MPTFETFSKRQEKCDSQGEPDVYQYDSLPEPFRIQVIHIWHDAIGRYQTGWGDPQPFSNFKWKKIHDTLSRELGVFDLGNKNHDLRTQCEEYLLAADTSGALDLIEVSFQMIESGVPGLSEREREYSGITQQPEDAIRELNHRFQEHGIGYRYESGEIIRVDSLYVHEEVVKPANSLLHDEGFRGASDEFMRAHEHYRKGRYKEAIAEALKAFESTMKAICDTRKWTYSENDTARPLINILLENGLIPKDLEGHFGGLRAALESGLPTISNRTSRHGQGMEPKEVPGYIAAYALHLAAADIVLLVEAHKALK